MARLAIGAQFDFAVAPQPRGVAKVAATQHAGSAVFLLRAATKRNLYTLHESRCAAWWRGFLAAPRNPKRKRTPHHWRSALSRLRATPAARLTESSVVWVGALIPMIQNTLLRNQLIALGVLRPVAEYTELTHFQNLHGLHVLPIGPIKSRLARSLEEDMEQALNRNAPDYMRL